MFVRLSAGSAIDEARPDAHNTDSLMPHCTVNAMHYIDSPTRERSHTSTCIMNNLQATYVFLILTIIVCSEAAGTCNSPDADVLILGAGFSGVAAAKTLFDAEIKNFLVLEARDEIGGRVRSMKFAGITVEVGANWIHGVRDETTSTENKPTNPLWTLKQRCGLKGVFTKLAWEPGPLKVYDTNGNNITNDTDSLRYNDIEEAEKNIGANITSQQRDGIPDRSIRSALINAGWNPTTPADNLLDFMNFNFGHANTPEKLSLYQTLQGDNTSNFGEDNFYVTDERGYAYLARCMGDEFNLTERLELNTTITTIDYSNSECVCATSESERKFCGKYAIVTFSIGVLQRNNDMFSPELPKSKRDAINSIRNGLFLRIYLEFNETFWDVDSDLVFIGRATQDIGDYAVFQPVGQYYPSNPNVLLAILTSERALEVANQNINITKGQIMDALRTIYPNFKAELLNILVPDWGSNPLYNGAFSSALVNLTDEMQDIIAAPIGNLYITGEGVSKNYYGYVHGGYFSGVDAANLVIRELRPSSAFQVISSIATVITITVCCLLTM